MPYLWDKEITADTIYLPAANEYNEAENGGVPINEEIQNYIKREIPFPTNESSKIVKYSIPTNFISHGEPQASKAEFEAYKCFNEVQLSKDDSNSSETFWQACFQGISYAGRSYRNSRDGGLMIREHDMVIFNVHKDKHYVSLIEVKSSCDDPTIGYRISDSAALKNIKRSGQHQLRDHLEILKNSCEIPVEEIHSYLFWPFLNGLTRDPNGREIKRWEKEKEMHVFADTISKQEKFNKWFHNSILSGKCMQKNLFDKILKRFIVLSCGIFVNEIRDGMLALLSQEQLELLYNKSLETGSPTIIHGAAGTGKTLLILHRLRFLYDCGMLNEKNRALYICYWPGIRHDVRTKLEKLNITQYVDSARFGISNDDFLLKNQNKYRHIYMDECEAISLAFNEKIVTNTFDKIGKCRLIDDDENYRIVEGYYHKNYQKNFSMGYTIERNEIIKIEQKSCMPVYGDLWYLVDINQATFFIPKYSPNILKKPTFKLTRVVRNTETIYRTFSEFYKNPLPTIPAAAKLSDIYLSDLEIGHKIKGPPIFWVNSDNIPYTPTEQEKLSSKTFNGLIRTIVDLYSAKGIKPNDMCILPFLISKIYLPDNINEAIEQQFVPNSVFHPKATTYIEEFISTPNPREFLIPWVLRVKGLEFKVVIIVIEQDDFDFSDPEDRRKMYIMASRSNCLLILVCSEHIKELIDIRRTIKPYQFDIDFKSI